MRIVQSFWSCNKDLLQFGFGWLSPQYHIMAWTLSCLRLKEYYDDLSFYTDTNGFELFVKYLNLPYRDVHIVYDDLHKHYDEKLWAVPKIFTYLSQNEPFIHVDGDVFIWERFSLELEKAGLICQNYETGTIYYKKIMNLELQKLIAIPKLLQDTLSQDSIPSINAGILGGNDVEFIKRYSLSALKLVEQNSVNDNSQMLSVNFNILFEQILFYALSQEQKKSITCFFERNFNDNGYFTNEIADFFAVPNRLKYLHIIGKKKKEDNICELLSRTLLRDYPSYYFKIIALFQNDHIHYKSKIMRLDGFPIYTALKSNKIIRSSNVFKEHITKQRNQSSLEKLKAFKENLGHEIIYAGLKNELNDYENELSSVFRSFAKITHKSLYDIEKISSTYFYFFELEKVSQLMIILRLNPHVYIIENSFNWSLESRTILNNDLIDESNSENRGLALVPSLFNNGYNEIIITELDYNILILLQNKCSFENLINAVNSCFESNFLTGDTVYKLLILRLKKLFFDKCIQIVNEN